MGKSSSAKSFHRHRQPCYHRLQVLRASRTKSAINLALARKSLNYALYTPPHSRPLTKIRRRHHHHHNHNHHHTHQHHYHYNHDNDNYPDDDHHHINHALKTLQH